MKNEVTNIGEAPPIGEVPKLMHAWTVRADRFGEPKDSFQREIVSVPEIGDEEVLVYTMAAGVNYNNVWAALGTPVDVIAARNKQGEPEDFHIGGSDASGIAYAVGSKVTNVKVGDEVLVHCGTWDSDCPMVRAGGDPMFSPSFRIWGYETNYGSFAQFSRVQAHQCMPKPKHMTWEEAASYSLVGATAYRMLLGWPEHAIKKDDVVLIWGGAGGLGSMAIQIARAIGAKPIAVVSDNSKFDYCKSLGAVGCINRKDFDHWGMLPHWKDSVGYSQWLKGVRSFGKAIWEALGEKRNPTLVFEHPGENTIPTSMFVCETGGSVVICAGTTGYNATVDLRYLWMRQKRLQGSHFANDVQAYAMNELAIQGHLNPCLSKTFTFDELPDSHQLMHENRHPHGNMAVLVGAPDFGLGASAPPPLATDHLSLPDDNIRDTPKPAPLSVPLPGVASNEGMDFQGFVDEGVLVRDEMRAVVVTCTPETTLDHVVRMMLDNQARSVVVVKNDQIAGVVSMTDVVMARHGRTKADARKIQAGDVMTPGCTSVDLRTPMSEAIGIMIRRRIHRLIVTQRQGHRDVPVGILAMTDLVKNLLTD